MNNAQQTTTTTSLQVASKSMVVAYVLWFLLGQLGIHRFYLGKTGTAITQLVLGLLGYGTLALLGFGFFFLVPLWIWLIVDIFLIPGMSNGAGLGTVTTTTTVNIPESTPSPTNEDN